MSICIVESSVICIEPCMGTVFIRTKGLAVCTVMYLFHLNTF